MWLFYIIGLLFFVHCVSSSQQQQLLPRVFVGGSFDYRSSLQSDRVNFYGVGIWDDQYHYWKDLGGGLLDRTLYYNVSTLPYSNDEVLSSFWDKISQQLYIGGRFTKIGGVTTSNIVSYNLDTKVWSPLTTSCDGDVLVILGVPEGIIVGGNFHTINGVNTGCLALLNRSSGAWTSLGLVGTSVFSLLLYNDATLYVSGILESAQQVPLKGLAAYDLAKQSWSSPGYVCGGFVKTMAQLNDYLYIGGNFTSFGGNYSCSIPGINIAEFDLINSTFTNTFVFDNSTFKGDVSLLLNHQDYMLLVAGKFSSIDSKFFDRFTYYSQNTSTWRPLSKTLSATPFSGDVYTGTSFGSVDYFGGYFTTNFWGVTLFDNNNIWGTLDSGLACSYCPEVSDGSYPYLRRIPWVNTMAILPPGTPLPQTPSPTVPQYQLIGSKGKWEEYGIDPFPGSAVFWGNSTNYVDAQLGTPKALSFYWQTWSVIGSAIFIGSLFLASVLHMCVRSLY